MDSFSARAQIEMGDESVTVYRLDALEKKFKVSRLPFCMKVLLENLLRNEDDKNVTAAHIEALANWQPSAEPAEQIAFSPARVILQDFTGVPAIVDLAVMRNAMDDLGGDATLINPQIPVDLVIDHSVMVDRFASSNALDLNKKLEFKRNRERYEFLRWGQEAFDNFRVVPPGTGIVHQVNLEFLAEVVTRKEVDGETLAYPDTLVGTDSHTTMINGLSVLGWGVGGIEAEAAMLGQPITMLLPQVVGFGLKGELPAGATATDLVLTVTQMLREKGVVGKFVEFYGDGIANLTLADRATISNMAPEYGATCGIFPIDEETLRYLRLSGRAEERVKLVEAYAREQGLWHEAGSEVAQYTDTLELELSQVEPSIAGPKRPQDRIALRDASETFRKHLDSEGRLKGAEPAVESESKFEGEGGDTAVAALQSQNMQGGVSFELDGSQHQLHDGAVVIAAITSCTNTSNPAVMMAAGLLARNARERGLKSKPWVKTSLAPGSQVVPHYLDQAGLMEPLRELGFHVVGFGCTTCIGNSGPLPEEVAAAIEEGDLVATSVLSGNRNFEGRIHQHVKANYLASPPLVVAYALAGSLCCDLVNDPLGEDGEGRPVYLKDIWPDTRSIADVVEKHVSSSLFKSSYDDVFEGESEWQKLQPPGGKTYQWPDSTYVKKPPYFDDMPAEPAELKPIENARCLVKVGDSITTDHISPAGAIAADSPAGKYLQEEGVSVGEFNSLGSRRGNHEVMMRGTFANVRLKNQLADGKEGSATTHFPSGDAMSIYDAGMRYSKDGVPSIVLAGDNYGTGSSRDWAAKGVNLLGVRAVIAASYERIHRSNLIGFGVLPLQFGGQDDADSLGLTGKETFTIGAVEDQPESVTVKAISDDGKELTFDARVRIDTPTEWDYFKHGGILQYVLRDLASNAAAGKSAKQA